MIYYKVVYTINELPNFSKDFPLFCDIESDGLYINTRLIQYYQPETSPTIFILDVDYFGNHTGGNHASAMFKALGRSYQVKVTPEMVKEFHKDKWLVWWNGSYDQGTLRHTSAKVDDLWYMAKLALPRLDAFNLDVVADHLFPHEQFYKGIEKKEMHKKGQWKPGSLKEENLRYAATDVFVMKLIWDKIYPMVGDKFVYRLDALNQQYCIQWQQTGLAINPISLKEAFTEYEEKLLDNRHKLPLTADGLTVNVNSPKQVKELLSAYHGKPIDSSDEDTLLHLAADFNCPYSKLILEGRGITKTISFLNSYSFDRVYANYNPFGTRTGRWSCKGGDREDAANLQQLPRKLKKIPGFTDDNDWVFVGADLPTAELRLAAAVYVDDVMVHAFKNNIDLHKLTASRTTGKPIEEITDDERKKAKAENFGLLYGMKAAKFQKYAFSNYELILSLEEAEQRRSNWLKAYPGIASKINEVTKRFFDHKKDPNKDDLLVSTPLGRWVKPDLYTDALNIPIQGAVAEIAKLWIHYLQKLHGNIPPIANFVHDSITLECHMSEAEYWKQKLEDSCAMAWSEYCKLPMVKVKDIPMPIEVGISKNYKGAS